MINKTTLVLVFFSISVLSFFTMSAAGYQQPATNGWKAGIARSVITPEESIWMGGYASRDHPSEGTLVDLWVKILALEDAKGKKAVLITTDLLGFPKKISERIRDKIAVHYGLTRGQIILSSSHTHTGPVLTDALFDIYPVSSEQIQVIKKYSESLEKKIVALTGEAIASLAPAQIFSQIGITRFQVNRRNNKEAELSATTELKGPNDYSVPVLKVIDSSGKLIAVTFGYACHATVLSIYQFSGDYPGYAQLEIEKLYPGATAMFFQGTGADQNPLPRRTIQLAQQYGRELASAVDRVLCEEMHKLEPVLATAYSEIDLPFATRPPEEELVKLENSTQGYQKSWATNQLKILRTNGSFITSYPYPVQIWRLGNQAVLTMGGEPVVQYSLELKKLFGPEIFVIGYANDVMAYIPSETILQEGGYEGESSQMVFGFPAKWETGIQSKILREFESLAVKAGVKKIEP
jgi:hypothetical protein